MDKEKFIEIMFNRILGEIEPIGETQEDNKRYSNFYMYEIALNLIKLKLIKCSKYKGRNEYSINRAGQEAYDILKELYAELKDYFREENNNGEII